MAVLWWRPTAALDATRMGSTNYTQAEIREVMAALQPLSFEHPSTVASIALSTGIQGRTVRSICADLDGQVCLMGYRGGRGLFVAHYSDEGEMQTDMIQRHWRAERQRVQRRVKFARDLPRRNLTLFDRDDLLGLDDDDDEDDDA